MSVEAFLFKSAIQHVLTHLLDLGDNGGPALQLQLGHQAVLGVVVHFELVEQPLCQQSGVLLQEDVPLVQTREQIDKILQSLVDLLLTHPFHAPFQVMVRSHGDKLGDGREDIHEIFEPHMPGLLHLGVRIEQVPHHGIMFGHQQNQLVHEVHWLLVHRLIAIQLLSLFENELVVPDRQIFDRVRHTTEHTIHVLYVIVLLLLQHISEASLAIAHFLRLLLYQDVFDRIQHYVERLNVQQVRSLLFGLQSLHHVLDVV